MLSLNKFKQIEESAYNLLNKAFIIEPSVPVNKVAKQLNLDVIKYNLGEGTSGVLFINNGIGTVGYNPLDPHVRQRFTIAHEIGHFLLHKENSELFVDRSFLIKKFRNNESSYSQKEYKEELEANAFAAALLMPKHFIQAEFAKEDLADLNELELINKLAKKFEVSVAAMSYRLSNLELYSY